MSLFEEDVESVIEKLSTYKSILEELDMQDARLQNKASTVGTCHLLVLPDGEIDLYISALYTDLKHSMMIYSNLIEDWLREVNVSIMKLKTYTESNQKPLYTLTDVILQQFYESLGGEPTHGE